MIELKPSLEESRSIQPDLFRATSPLPKEIRKAQIKNRNLPILQYLYQGDPLKPMQCALLETPAFTHYPCIVRKVPIYRFRIEFNHIRQRARLGKQTGDSVDKDFRYGPSELFRSRPLELNQNIEDLLEFMCMMPVSSEAHRYINQSSTYGDITLMHYDHHQWPWVLRSQDNFQEFVDWIGAAHRIGVTRDWLVDHLSSVDYPRIWDRVEFKTQQGCCWLEVKPPKVDTALV